MTDSIDDRIKRLGLTLPEPVAVPPGISIPFSMVRVIGNRVLVSGHGPQNDDGSISEPLGQLGCCLLYTSPSPRDATLSRMPSSA